MTEQLEIGRHRSVDAPLADDLFDFETPTRGVIGQPLSADPLDRDTPVMNVSSAAPVKRRGNPSRPAGKCAQKCTETLRSAGALQTSPSDGGGDHQCSEPQLAVAPDNTPLIVMEWRRRQNLVKARIRLSNQCFSYCLRWEDGDKEKAAKLWASVQAGTADPSLCLVLAPYLEGIDPLKAAQHQIELGIRRLVRKTPLWIWAKDVKGLGELGLGAIIGMGGRRVAEYRTVSGLWKTMELAVINGERQRRCSDAAKALEHGYGGKKRAEMYVISVALMRAQGTAPETCGPYRRIYDRRKAFELEKGLAPIIAHNRAMRVMIKELLKHAWIADRSLS